MEHNDEEHGTELERVRARIHKMNDMLQSHENRLAIQDVQIKTIIGRIDQFFNEMATGEQLRNAVAQIELKLLVAKGALELAVSTLAANIAGVHDDLAPIQAGITWIGRLVIGAIILGILSLLFKTGKP